MQFPTDENVWVVIVFDFAFTKRVTFRHETLDRSNHCVCINAAVPLVLPILCIDVFGYLDDDFAALSPKCRLGKVIVANANDHTLGHLRKGCHVDDV